MTERTEKSLLPEPLERAIYAEIDQEHRLEGNAGGAPRVQLVVARSHLADLPYGLVADLEIRHEGGILIAGKLGGSRVDLSAFRPGREALWTSFDGQISLPDETGILRPVPLFDLTVVAKPHMLFFCEASVHFF